MNPEQIKFIINNIGPEITRLKGLPKEDVKRIDAFFMDWRDAVASCKSINEVEPLMQIPVVMAMLAMDCSTKFGLFNWDPFKPFRFKADEIALAMVFKRYIAIRKL